MSPGTFTGFVHASCGHTTGVANHHAPLSSKTISNIRTAIQYQNRHSISEPPFNMQRPPFNIRTAIQLSEPPFNIRTAIQYQNRHSISEPPFNIRTAIQYQNRHSISEPPFNIRTAIQYQNRHSISKPPFNIRTAIQYQNRHSISEPPFNIRTAIQYQNRHSIWQTCPCAPIRLQWVSKVNVERSSVILAGQDRLYSKEPSVDPGQSNAEPAYFETKTLNIHDHRVHWVWPRCDQITASALRVTQLFSQHREYSLPKIVQPWMCQNLRDAPVLE